MATYTVNAGDSISKIALAVLGDITRWPEIARVNALRPPYVIYPGQILQLPIAAPGPEPAALAPIPATLAPRPAGMPWLRNPLLWVSVVGLAWWWFRGRRGRRRR